MDDRDVAMNRKLQDMLDRHADELGEHFDCVQVFASRWTGSTTLGLAAGTGNIFAREGQVTRWLEVALEPEAEADE